MTKQTGTVIVTYPQFCSSHSRRKQYIIRRFTAVFVLLLLLLATCLVCRNGAEPAEQFVYQPVVVQYGDTLWRLAENSGIQMDTRTLVLKIMAYNSLAGSTIHPGQTIYIPIPCQARILAAN
jgi:LysM repeat protein